MGRALGVGWIGARSAQGKGRAERTWGTLQDRLVVELRRETIATIDDANAFLPTFLERYNRRFAVPPIDPVPAWGPWPAGRPAEAVLCFHYPHRVARDATISWAGEALALPRRPDGRAWGGRSVTLQERLDGSLWVSHGELCLTVAPAPATPILRRARDRSRLAEDRDDIELGNVPVSSSPSLIDRRPRQQPPDHPWKKYPAVRPRVTKSLAD